MSGRIIVELPGVTDPDEAVAATGIAVRGLSYGLEFSGGRLLEYDTARPVDLDRLRAELAGAGLPGPAPDQEPAASRRPAEPAPAARPVPAGPPGATPAPPTKDQQEAGPATVTPPRAPAVQRQGDANMEIRIREEPHARNGRHCELAAASGQRVVVVVHRGGSCDLAIAENGTDVPSSSATLDIAEAVALAELLTGARVERAVRRSRARRRRARG